MKKTNNKGFSLVELIIVIAIMAILAGAIAPALIRYIDSQESLTMLAHVRQLRQQLRLHLVMRMYMHS